MKNSEVDNCFLSVRLMTYNHEAFITQALKGIDIQQTTFLFEVVVGDDFSKDGTLNKIKNYQFSNPNLRLKILNREIGDEYYWSRRGKGRLFNFVNILNNCSGKYIALLDGDDYWSDPLKLQHQVGFLEENSEFTMSFHNVNILNLRQSKNAFSSMHKNLVKDVFTTKDLLGQWFIPTSSIVYRNEKSPLPDWFIHCGSGDIPLMLLLSLQGKIKYLNSIMGVYRLHDKGISIEHSGYAKVFSMIFIYQHFNIYTNSRFEKEINEAMIYEIRKHLPEAKELQKIQSNSYRVRVKKLLQNFKRRYFKSKMGS